MTCTAQVRDATVEAQSTVTAVQQAQLQTQPPADEATELKMQADQLHARMEATSQQAVAAASLEQQVFVEAENTLEVMENF